MSADEALLRHRVPPVDLFADAPPASPPTAQGAAAEEKCSRDVSARCSVFCEALRFCEALEDGAALRVTLEIDEQRAAHVVRLSHF